MKGRRVGGPPIPDGVALALGLLCVAASWAFLAYVLTRR